MPSRLVSNFKLGRNEWNFKYTLLHPVTLFVICRLLARLSFSKLDMHLWFILYKNNLLIVLLTNIDYLLIDFDAYRTSHDSSAILFWRVITSTCHSDIARPRFRCAPCQLVVSSVLINVTSTPYPTAKMSLADVCCHGNSFMWQHIQIE